jgi:hypothetical protein
VLSIIGDDVFIMKPGSNEWVKAEEGINLGVNYKIRTEVMSQATISFFDGSTIELQGETEVSLSELNFDTESSTSSIRLRQEAGQTISRVKKLADPKSRYEIETPAAVAAVRGTSFFVGVSRDGKTFVGNIEGLVSVIAQGVEVEIKPGNHVMIVPGQAPGPNEPGVTPSPTTPLTDASSAITEPGSPSAAPVIPGRIGEPTNSKTTPEPVVAKIAMETTADRQSTYPGDTIVYTYKVTNPGPVPLSGILVQDNRVGEGVLKSGDTNSNKKLDTDETWIFSANYLVLVGNLGLFTNTAIASGNDPDNNIVVATANATVNVLSIIVKITSLQQGDVVGRGISIGGTVNDPSVAEATIKVNNESSTIKVINGIFNASVNLADGTNIITVTVTKAGGVIVTETVTLVPKP